MQLLHFAHLGMNRRLRHIGQASQDFADEGRQWPLGTAFDEQSNAAPVQRRHGLAQAHGFDELTLEVRRELRKGQVVDSGAADGRVERHLGPVKFDGVECLSVTRARSRDQLR
ncbi:MAG TPA: hypothetical protein VIV60_22885, partial [Polyangiaceae bacterium]